MRSILIDICTFLTEFIPPFAVIILPVIISIVLFRKGHPVIAKIALSLFTGEVLAGAWLAFSIFTEDYSRFLECRKDFFFIASIVLLFILVLFLFFSEKKNKIIIVLMCIAFTAFGSLTVKEVITAKNYLSVEILTQTDDYDILNFYHPKYGHLTATLSEKSSLTLPNDNNISFDGATALYPVYSAFAKATGVERVECNRTSLAYESLCEGLSDIIFAAAPSQKQLDYAEEVGVELQLTPIGREAFVFFVNSDNEINSLTSQQLRDIYSGKTTTWGEVGAKGKLENEKILPYQRNEGSGSQSALIRFMGDTPITEPLLEGRFLDMGGIIEDVADYRNLPTAIGFSFRFYTTEMRNNGHIKLLSVDGVEPTKENIENGTYPISNYFYAVTRKDNDDEYIRQLLDFFVSPQGQELIEKTGYSGVE